MNKKMRELLVQIEAKTKEARYFQDAKDTEKASSAMTEIENLQKEYEVEEKLFKAEQQKVPDEPEKGKDTGISAEEKAFVDYCKGITKELSAGSNGAVIPGSVANKIIEAVKELSPIYSKATIYNAKGTLSIPVYGLDDTDYIQAAYGTEFTDLTAHAGKFTSVDLTSLAIGALAKISKNLVNNTDIDVLSFVTQKIAQAIADFLEKELLVGTGATGHMTGATKTTNLVNAGGLTAASVTADKLADLQLTVPQVYQPDACWIFNKDVYKAVRKLKDGNGDYLLVRDFLNGSGWTLLGKAVYISDNMPAVAENAIPVLYGDFSGMACKLAKNVEIQVLNELYAAQHAVGVVGWVEADSKIENAQKFVGLKMAV